MSKDSDKLLLRTILSYYYHFILLLSFRYWSAIWPTWEGCMSRRWTALVGVSEPANSNQTEQNWNPIRTVVIGRPSAGKVVWKACAASVLIGWSVCATPCCPDCRLMTIWVNSTNTEWPIFRPSQIIFRVDRSTWMGYRKIRKLCKIFQSTSIFCIWTRTATYYF